MAEKLKFSTEQAETVARDINRKADELLKTMNDVKRTMDEVSGWWEGGNAAKMFSAQYQNIKPNVDKLIECVNAISAQVREMIKLQDEEDQQMAAQLKKTN